MKQHLTLFALLTAIISFTLLSCDRGHDDYWYDRGYNPGGNTGGGSQDNDEPTLAGGWKGELNLSYSRYDHTFISNKQCILVTPNTHNSQIGEGEMVCFYDDTASPIAWESLYFTWYTNTDGSVAINFPCDPSLNSTLRGTTIKGGVMTGVSEGGISTLFTLEPISDDYFADWGLYDSTTKYGVSYRNIPISGQWTGSMGIYYEEGGETWDAEHSNIRFIPSKDNELRGKGEDQEFYTRPCPVKYESLEFEWEEEDGILYLNYPSAPELSLAVYDIVIAEDQFYCSYNSNDEVRTLCLSRLPKSYTDWNLYDPDQHYTCVRWETPTSEARSRKIQRNQSHGTRRNLGTKPERKGRVG